MSNSVSRVQICTLLLLTATAVVVPLISFGFYPGDDLSFHTSLWFETARQWHEGIPYARWAGQAAYGYGTPAMVFYPPLSRILGGALVALLPSRWIVVTYGWLGLVLAGFSFFYMAREFLDDRSSLLGAFAYIINPYNLCVLYIRCAFAEFLAAALFPLLVLSVLRLTTKGKRSIAALAVCVAVFWLTNIPAAVIANYLAAVMVVALALVRRSKLLLGRFAVAEVLGAGLAAFYLLPARVERPLIDVGQILAWNPLVSFLLTSNWYRHTSWMDLILNVGFLWQVAVGMAGWLIAKNFWTERRDISIALLAVLGFSAFMCVSASSLFWKHAPFLPYVQFPWRWLFAVNFAAAFFLAAAMVKTNRHAWLGVAACACSFLIFFSYSSVRKRVLNWEELEAPFRSAAPIDGAGDYVPRASGFDPDSRPPAWMHTPHFVLLDREPMELSSSVARPVAAQSVKLPDIAIQSWDTEARSFSIDSADAVRLRVRLFYFPGWRVWVNGIEVPEVERDEHDAVMVRAPSGRSQVQLKYRWTRDQTWGMAVSGGIAVLVVGLFVLSGKDARAGKVLSGRFGPRSSALPFGTGNAA